MVITRVSQLTGLTHSIDIDVTEEQLKRYEEGKELIQNIFPSLSPSDREFLITGSTPEEWDDMFNNINEENEER